MDKIEKLTKEEVDRALKNADDVLLYAQARNLISIEKKMENIIRVIVKLDGR